jgi:hypothetical protein
MSPGTYSTRFGSLRKAYGIIGYGDENRLRGADSRLRTIAMREELISRIAVIFPNDVRIVRPGIHWRSRLRVFKRLTVSVLIVRSALVYKNTRRWLVEPNVHERRFITLLARLNESNREIVDFHVLPSIDRRTQFQITDAWLKRGIRLGNLSQFSKVVAQVARSRRNEHEETRR